MRELSEAIRQFILRSVDENPDSVVRIAKDHFGVSRQAVSRHAKALVTEGLLTTDGNTRARSYGLATLSRDDFSYSLSARPEEHVVWEEQVFPLVREKLSDNAREICFYGFTEMFNNAVDHSEGTSIGVRVIQSAVHVTIWITDNGVGIFNKIAKALNLPAHEQALLELSKGKFTTDPDRHTGEGIFFTSRVFDRFAICSGHLSFFHNDDGNDWLFGQAKYQDEAGTSVMLKIAFDASHTLKQVFDRYSSGEEGDYGFARTHVPLKLAQFGESNLVSRSQAKRVLVRFDRFEEVLLDFEGVKSIGQAFADEIFRVFAKQNPSVKLNSINANSQTRQMISRAQDALRKQAEANSSSTPPPA